LLLFLAFIPTEKLGERKHSILSHSEKIIRLVHAPFTAKPARPHSCPFAGASAQTTHGSAPSLEGQVEAGELQVYKAMVEKLANEINELKACQSEWERQRESEREREIALNQMQTNLEMRLQTLETREREHAAQCVKVPNANYRAEDRLIPDERTAGQAGTIADMDSCALVMESKTNPETKQRPGPQPFDGSHWKAEQRLNAKGVEIHDGDPGGSGGDTDETLESFAPTRCLSRTTGTSVAMEASGNRMPEGGGVPTNGREERRKLSTGHDHLAVTVEIGNLVRCSSVHNSDK